MPVSSLKAAVEPGLPEPFKVRLVKCMAGCVAPRTVGFQAAGKAQYLFGQIEDSDDADALVLFAEQYLNSDTGWTNSTERPLALRDKTLARLPGINGGAA
jgi:predicted metal-binding protein